MWRTATRSLLALAALSLACSSAYYGALEKLGKPKREILVDRVGAVRDDQNAAKEEFKDALEKFRAFTGFEGGELEAKYETLADALADCEARAKAVSDRIGSIDDVSTALFDEWQAELAQYKSAELRRSSEAKLRATKARYVQLQRALVRAQKSMDPVLAAFRDQVLYLKHNLNARAIASLRGEVGAIEGNVAKLVREMEASIREADRFVAALASENN